MDHTAARVEERRDRPWWRRPRSRSDHRILGEVRRLDAALAQGPSGRDAAVAAAGLRTLLDADAVGIADLSGEVAWAGVESARAAAQDAVTGVLDTGRAISRRDPPVVARPLQVRDEPVGVLVVAGAVSSAAVREAAQWAAGAIEHGRLAASAEVARRGELRELRAQMSPHFVYNALTTIASFTRSDPDRARELILELADYTRHSLARSDEYTTLAGEFRAIEAYLTLAKAVLGDRLRVTVRFAPEVLPVALPFLVLQPLVENAVRHGVERPGGSGLVQVTGEADGGDCVITVEDDGPGMAPEHARDVLAGAGTRVGLVNVDRRLRAVYGASRGVVVETALGAGTRVVVRIPRFHPGVVAT